MNDVGTVSGYGFSIENLTVERTLLFAIHHRSVLAGFNDSLDKILDFYEIYHKSLSKMKSKKLLKIFASEFTEYPLWFEEIEDKISGTPGYGAIIASTIYLETKIRVGFEMDNDNEVVIFYSSMPWEFNDKEKMLTENSLKTLLKSYMDELEIPEEEYRFYHMVFM